MVAWKTMKKKPNRRVFGKVYRGRGGYYTDKVKPFLQKFIPKGSFKKAGAYLGKYLGGAPGGAVGSALGNKVSNVLGFGAYQVHKNSLVNSTAEQVPYVHAGRDGVRIRHREFLQDLSGSTTFTATTFAINPGQAATFPWLSQIAANFEEYRFDGLVFEYISSSGDAIASTNNSLGEVFACVDYSAGTSSLFTNKQTMENSMWCVTAKPSLNMTLPVECEPKLNPIGILYVRTGAVPSGFDQRLYDLGTAGIATQGQQAAVTIGSWFVSYDVMLYKPVLEQETAVGSAHYKCNTYTNAAPFTGHTSVYDSIGLSFTNTVVTFPTNLSGTYYINIIWVGTSVTISSPSATWSSNVTGVNIFLNSTNSTLNNNAEVGAVAYYMACMTFSGNGAAQTLTLGTGGTLPSSGAYCDFIMTEINSALTS